MMQEATKWATLFKKALLHWYTNMDDLASRSPAPLLLVDLAVPRDIDPAVAGVPGVEVYALDDLHAFVEGTLRQRLAELPAAYAVLHSEVARFTTWLGRREPVAA